MASKKNESVKDTVKLPGVAAPENALVGDENLPEPREVKPEVHQDEVPAQVTGQPAKPVETVRVHETHVALDEVITDPNDPRAVQIPDAGRGSLLLPIHDLDAPRPEDVFASEAAKIEERDGDPQSASDPNPDAKQ